VQELLAADNIPIELAGTNATSSVYYGCRIYSEDADGEPVFNFWHLDHVLDVLLSAGVKPIMECDYMPDALAEGQPIRNYGGGLINTPNDYMKWRELVYETVKHCIDRYGVDEVRSWYWECWNEPDLENYFIDGVPSGVSPTADQMERFFQMYDYFAAGAKAADPAVRVGGPAIADHPEWLRLFLEHCDTGTNYATGDTGAPLDFISWHSYGLLDDIGEKNRIMQDIIELFPKFTDLPQLLDEWGRIGLESALYTNYEATFLCKLLESVLGEASRQLNLFLRWSELLVSAFKTGYNPLSFMVDGHLIPYPVMNAYTMLTKMGNESLELAISSYASNVGGFASHTDNGIQILIYRLEEGYEGDGQPVEIDLIVEGLTDSSYSLKHYRIDSQHSNAATLWEDMGQPANPSVSQVAQLESDSQLQLLDEPSQITTQNGQVTIRLSIPYNSMSLVILGEESIPMFAPGVHITQVLQYEAMYQSAEQKLAEGDMEGAREYLEELIRDCVPSGFSTSGPDPYCFWGQKALFTLGKLEEELGNYDAADRIWQRLLSTTLNDTDRLILLQRRIQYMAGQPIKPPEFNSLVYELVILRSEMEVYAEWEVWSDTTAD
jgi:xylan 1,4-beta-xylosidase